MKPVTDPELLRQLNAPEAPAAPSPAAGLKPVTDPAILRQLNAPTPDTPTAAPEPGLGQKILGAGEAALSAATGAAAGPIGAVAGAMDIPFTMLRGTYGTQQGAQEAGKVAEDVTRAWTYQPHTQAGRQYTEKVGDWVRNMGIGSLAPEMAVRAPPAARQAAPSVARAVQEGAAAIPKIKSALPKLTRATDQPQMGGVGAAETSDAAMRRARAQALPVPIELTKGQAERTFEQQQFERETAKDPNVGEPLRQRFAEQNRQMVQNFDAWVDQTGAQAPTARDVGQTVNTALVKKAEAAKREINAAYEEAKKAGELAAPVSTQRLVDYINSNRPESINAPVLQSIEQKLIQLKGASVGPDGRLVAGQMSVNDMEEIRKMIGRISDTTPTNLRFGIDAKKMIDVSTEGSGGPIYARARRMRERYAEEFKDRNVIAKLLATKPGSADRAVAFEDVFSHTMLNGSLDDVRAVRRTLQTGGEEGQQAWRELQGATIGYLKDIATRSVARDIYGNPIISPAALDKAVTTLDKDGKLDFIFGKQGAQQIRDVNELAKDVYTSPPGSVNTSNTSSALIKALDLGASAMTGLPVPVASALKWTKEKLQRRKVTKRVEEALGNPPGAMNP